MPAPRFFKQPIWAVRDFFEYTKIYSARGKRLPAARIVGNADMICIHHFYAFRALKPRASQRAVPIPREAIDPQCRATDRSRHCQATRAIAEGLICLTKIKVLPSRQSLSFFGGN
jgi:hypothetical protein